VGRIRYQITKSKRESATFLINWTEVQRQTGPDRTAQVASCIKCQTEN
jgi:hypothetical protein